ncbi:MAG: hypothetical protein LAT51_09075 [Flavobacteriaceae bacterium]|nr:hypothetical protein [Flavobacteriaceae bacterium]
MIKIYPVLFTVLFFLISCERQSNSIELPEPIITSDELPNSFEIEKAGVKIYFENTLSMDGYINGNTNFKDVFRELLVAVDNEKKINFDTEFYLINDKLTPTNFGVENTKISEKLTPQSTAKIGNKTSSNFEEIFNTILQKQDGNMISVIMADFIYSPKGEPNTISALNKLRTYTKDAFLKATTNHENLETKIYSFKSDFKGIYYDINDKSITGLNNRPYYYFVIAPTELMSFFINEIEPQLKKAVGFKHEAFFTSNAYSPVPFAILSSTANKGRLKVRNGNLEVANYPKEGNLEFSVLFDFSSIPIDNEYLMNTSNYQLSNPMFSIKNIGIKEGKSIDFINQPSTKIHPGDLVSIMNKKFTHAIIFEADGIVSEDLSFALRKKVPSWVKESHSDDDRQIYNDSLEQSKTFGLGHLIEGISEAYLQNGNDQYFDVTIPIN